jgi:hypothetical protein
MRKRYYYPTMTFYRYNHIDDLGMSHIVITSQDPPLFPVVNGCNVPTRFSWILKSLVLLGRLLVEPSF